MPKYDVCHFQVEHALQKDGWQIIQQGWHIDDDYTNVLYIDLVATRQNDGLPPQTIYVEVKCFSAPRSTPDLHRALGQFITYRAILDQEGFSEPLLMAVPEASFADYFNSAILAVVKAHEVKLLVIDLEHEKVVQWIM